MSSYDYRQRLPSPSSPEIVGQDGFYDDHHRFAHFGYMPDTSSEQQMFAFDEDPKSFSSFSAPIHSNTSHDPFSDFNEYSPMSATMSAFPSPTSNAFELGVQDSQPYFYNQYGEVVSQSTYDDNNFYNWVHRDPESPTTASSPIAIPSDQQQQWSPQSNGIIYPIGASFSPSDLAAHYPLPASPSSFDDVKPHHGFSHFAADESTTAATSPPAVPAWAHMWDDAAASISYGGVNAASTQLQQPHHDSYPQPSSTPRVPFKGVAFQPSSAPSELAVPLSMTASAMRRRGSASTSEDSNATVRRTMRKRVLSQDEMSFSAELDIPAKSLLKPPKLAPSAWQLYFTDWIAHRQSTGHHKKLNVAQAAKEAGQDYAALTDAEKEPYRKRSLAAKELREVEHQAYMHSLTPADIKKENQFRASQRKAGKSRKSNIKDPNAPRKPLSAYFMFLQRIRSDPQMVAEVFGRESETTKQSVLAAAKWRSMTDDQRKPFLAQAEQEKLDYEAARRMYEEGNAGNPALTNFSIMPGSPAERAFRASRVKREPSSDDSEGISTDDDKHHRFHQFTSAFR